MPNKPPAFQFYPKDFLGDPNVAVMEAAPRGSYITLMCYDWINDGIRETDFPALSLLSNEPEQVFDSVRRLFEQHPEKEGFVTNPRLYRERKRLQEKRELKAEAGRASGRKRRSISKKEHKRTPVQFRSNKTRTKPNSSSSSSSSVSTPSSPPSGDDPVPYRKIVETFHAACPSLPKVKSISGNRKRFMRGRWNEGNRIEQFREVFELAEKSDFLRNGNDRWAGADFEWLIRPANWPKVIEGNYDNGRNGRKTESTPAADEREHSPAATKSTVDQFRERIAYAEDLLSEATDPEDRKRIGERIAEYNERIAAYS